MSHAGPSQYGWGQKYQCILPRLLHPRNSFEEAFEFGELIENVVTPVS